MIKAILRHYYAAHAPADPQMWFRPVVTPAPVRPTVPLDLTPVERHDYEGFRADFMNAKDMKSPRMQAFATEAAAFNRASGQWSAYAEKQRHAQWPRAWAEAVLGFAQ